MAAGPRGGTRGERSAPRAEPAERAKWKRRTRLDVARTGEGNGTKGRVVFAKDIRRLSQTRYVRAAPPASTRAKRAGWPWGGDIRARVEGRPDPGAREGVRVSEGPRQGPARCAVA